MSDNPPDSSSFLFQVDRVSRSIQREDLLRFLDLSPRSYDRAVKAGDIVDDSYLECFAVLLNDDLPAPPEPPVVPLPPVVVEPIPGQ